MKIEEQLMRVSREMIRLRGDTSTTATLERDQAREKIKLIGMTAAFFGGFDGMTKLHDTCEKLTGDRNEIGDVLNRAWDRIGGWCA